MNKKTISAVSTAALLTGCLTGNSFPEKYAAAYCGALFTCVPSNQIDFFGYDTEEECTIDEAKNIRASSAFDDFEEGDKVFNSVAAENCILEAEQVRSDDDCNGNMDLLSFTLDAIDSDCADVYE